MTNKEMNGKAELKYLKKFAEQTYLDGRPACTLAVGCGERTGNERLVQLFQFRPLYVPVSCLKKKRRKTTI